MKHIWNLFAALVLFVLTAVPAFATQNPSTGDNSMVALALVGIIYIIETLSDILQVGYFKLTHGKRIFKMAPIHHHFEMCGWSENKIVTIFTAVSTLFCALALFGVMNRMV